MKLQLYFVLILSIINGNLSAQAVDQWLTRFEKSNFFETPDYNETMEYCSELVNASEYAKMFSFGLSPQGRDINCIIVSKARQFEPDDLDERERPVLLVINGIHSGEINGKDASMLLLREILVTKEKENLIENVDLLIVPIFSVDGHERRSLYGRINQIGPKETGWRVTAQNINLNRDFLKADAPEMQALLRLYSKWLPEFFIDVHSTNGSDFQYQTTFAIEKHENTTPMIKNWVEEKFNPSITRSVEDKGFAISPFVGFVKGDPRNGIYDWVPTPRFSNGYTTLQNRPGLLVESHVLKTYKERVFSTKAVLESTLELINSDPEELLKLARDSDEYAVESFIEEARPYPLTFERSDNYEIYNYKGIDYDLVKSEISGSEVKVFNEVKFEQKVKYFNHAVSKKKIKLPPAYIVPKQWKEIVERLKIHGVLVDRLGENKKYVVEKYQFSDVEFPSKPYEGRFRPVYKHTISIDTVVVPTGDYIIGTDQRSLGIIAHALEPDGPDSFVQWGFFNIIFERKEYYESYALEPIAQKMLENNPLLQQEFKAKLRVDENFANDPKLRFDFFYEHSPYYDKNYNLYPVLRVIEELDD